MGNEKTLSYLTPQGSEFVEFEECYNYIKEQLREGHEAKKQLCMKERTPIHKART